MEVAKDVLTGVSLFLNRININGRLVKRLSLKTVSLASRVRVPYRSPIGGSSTIGTGTWLITERQRFESSLPYHMRVWRNWQTPQTQNLMSQDVWVRVPPPVPFNYYYCEVIWKELQLIVVLAMFMAI